jgi:hypothetical protein
MWNIHYEIFRFGYKCFPSGCVSHASSHNEPRNSMELFSENSFKLPQIKILCWNVIVSNPIWRCFFPSLHLLTSEVSDRSIVKTVSFHHWNTIALMQFFQKVLNLGNRWANGSRECLANHSQSDFLWTLHPSTSREPISLGYLVSEWSLLQNFNCVLYNARTARMFPETWRESRFQDFWVNRRAFQRAANRRGFCCLAKIDQQESYFRKWRKKSGIAICRLDSLGWEVIHERRSNLPWALASALWAGVPRFTSGVNNLHILQNEARKNLLEATCQIARGCERDLPRYGISDFRRHCGSPLSFSEVEHSFIQL